MTREHYDQLLKDLDEAVVSMGDVVGERRLIQADNFVDDRRYEIETQALLLIATQQPLAGDLRNVAAILTVATELERVGDYCEGIAELTLRMAAEPALGDLGDIRSMAQIVPELLREALIAFRDRDVEAAGRVWIRDDEVDVLYEQVFRHLLAEMVEDPTTVRRGTYLLWVAHNLERMADRVTNIAERVAFVVTGDVAVFRERLEARTLPR